LGTNNVFYSLKSKVTVSSGLKNNHFRVIFANNEMRTATHVLLGSVYINYHTIKHYQVLTITK